jgi:hypothetical protein
MVAMEAAYVISTPEGWVHADWIVHKAPFELVGRVFEVWSFLGLTGYYRRFNLNFSKIAKPIIELLKKGNKYIYNDACDRAFKVLKKQLTTSPVLT